MQAKFEIPVSDLERCLSSTMPFRAWALTSSVLEGINLRVCKNEELELALKFAATDKHRIVIARSRRTKCVELAAQEKVPFGITLGASRLKQLKSILKHCWEGSIMVTLELSQVSFQLKDYFCLKIPALQGSKDYPQYPDYEHFIPKAWEYAIEVRREDLIKAIKAIGVLGKYGHMVLDIDSNTQQASLTKASRNNYWQATVSIPGEVIGEDRLQVCIDREYLKSGVKSLCGDRIQILANSATSPVCFKATTSEMDIAHMIMPVEVNRNVSA